MKKLLILLAAMFVLLAGTMLLTACHQEPEAQVPPDTSPQATDTATEPVTEPPTEAPTEPPFIAACTDQSDPANWNTRWEIFVDGALTDSYQREEPIFFEDNTRSTVPGVPSFRGGNYRTESDFGTAQVTEGTINKIWEMHVGYWTGPEWNGCCWTGQPLVAQWDAETRAIMNLYEEKKAKDGLVEAIYAKSDGYVHFIDMEDGSFTRDPLKVGMSCKGSGSLDPRGYPILYVGSGLISGGMYPRMFAISLIDGSVLFERSGEEDIALRYWYAFDGAPLVDPETDTLIWAGESGILYTIKLNTSYDKATGTLTLDPEEPVMTRYQDDYTDAGRNYGYESSVAAVENYLYVGNNAGLLHCVDVNTMELVWAQDITDDINATPLFDWGADGNGYIYTAPSMDYSGYLCDLPLCKLDARTGEVVWAHRMTCGTMEGIPGGILSSPMLGRAGSNIENMIVFTVGCSPNASRGQVVALDKETGQVIWQYEISHYTWSSPVAVYTDDGKGYIFQADSRGGCYLLDGATGELLDRIELGTTVEATPVAFGDRILIGSRYLIYLLDIN